jgi:hypothetical protein
MLSYLLALHVIVKTLVYNIAPHRHLYVKDNYNQRGKLAYCIIEGSLNVQNLIKFPHSKNPLLQVVP